MHKIHFPSCYVAEFLQRVRDPRLTDPIVDLLGPDVLGINNLYIWKAPEIGLGFPWHQDMFYFRQRFVTETTVGTWTAVDAADRGNGCLYVIPGSHRRPIAEHDELAGSQQSEFKLARGTRDEEGVALEAEPGTVIWFHSHLLHKSTDNHSGRFRRSYVSHYLSAQARWTHPERAGTGVPVMWVRGTTFPGKVSEVHRDVTHRLSGQSARSRQERPPRQVSRSSAISRQGEAVAGGGDPVGQEAVAAFLLRAGRCGRKRSWPARRDPRRCMNRSQSWPGAQAYFQPSRVTTARQGRFTVWRISLGGVCCR